MYGSISDVCTCKYARHDRDTISIGYTLRCTYEAMINHHSYCNRGVYITDFYHGKTTIITAARAPLLFVCHLNGKATSINEEH